jgi:hypothetical protein
VDHPRVAADRRRVEGVEEALASPQLIAQQPTVASQNIASNQARDVVECVAGSGHTLNGTGRIEHEQSSY